MTRTTFEDWIPEEFGGPVITKIGEASAVEALASHIPMGTDTRHIPRDGGMSYSGAIAKGAAYTEDSSTNDDVLLTVRKHGKVLRVADEDLQDAAQVANIIQTKQLAWARSYAIGFDNATLGVTAAENGTTIPHTSLYKVLTTADGDTGYVANANLIQTTGALDLADVSGAWAKLETGSYWNDADAFVIAHPAFKQYFRDLGRNIFSEYDSQAAGTPDRLMGAPIRWSVGAKTSATATDAPAGNPLLFVGNSNYMVVGDRSGPEYMLAGADSGPAFLTDEALLKVRVRKAFAVTMPQAFACIEITV